MYAAAPADPAAGQRADVALNVALFAAALTMLAIGLVFAAAASARGAAAALAAELGGERGDSLAHYGRSAWASAFPAGMAAAIACVPGQSGVLTLFDHTLSLPDMAARYSPLEVTFVLLAPLLTAAAATLGARAGAASAFDRADRLR
jgi:hypothetical protein